MSDGPSWANGCSFFLSISLCNYVCLSRSPFISIMYQRKKVTAEIFCQELLRQRLYSLLYTFWELDPVHSLFMPTHVLCELYFNAKSMLLCFGLSLFYLKTAGSTPSYFLQLFFLTPLHPHFNILLNNFWNDVWYSEFVFCCDHRFRSRHLPPKTN